LGQAGSAYEEILSGPSLESGTEQVLFLGIETVGLIWLNGG
jgi:hypothetical protein